LGSVDHVGVITEDTMTALASTTGGLDAAVVTGSDGLTNEGADSGFAGSSGGVVTLG